MLRLFWSSGLPWSSHDGYPRDRDTSGKYLKGDRFRADGVTLATSTLALGWWFGRSDAYLRRAVLLLRTFFLDEATSMNPNMNFAQGVPGRVPGEPGGTVDFGRMYVLPWAPEFGGRIAFRPRNIIRWYLKWGVVVVVPSADTVPFPRGSNTPF